MCPITILVAAGQDILRAGIRTLIEQQNDLLVTAEARNLEEALELARTHTPQLVLIASDLPASGGLLACREVKELLPKARVLIVGTAPVFEEAIAVIAAGAGGFLLATADKERLLLAVRAVAAGEMFVDPAVAGLVIGQLLGSQGAAAKIDPLSGRELEVLALLASGYTNKGIALRLSVSEATVKTHVSHILGKLGVERRVDAARQAVRLGLDRTA